MERRKRVVKPHKKRFCGPLTPMAKRRIELGMTQKQLGEKVGICRVYITNIENGIRPIDTISAAIAMKIARALDCDLADLLYS